jgi:MSHA biogenesis protein MshG
MFMPRYQVQAAAANGCIVTEILEAATERAALAQIKSGGMTPISVRLSAQSAKSKVSSTAGSRRFLKPRRGKPMRRALLDLTHQLTAVCESGIPVIAGLKAIAEQTTHPAVRPAVQRIIGRIEGGRSLADAMASEPDIFPDIYAKTIAAGETAGKLPEVLAALARYQDQEAETRSQIRSAMTYPCLVVFALVIAVVFMVVFVVPQFATLFDKFNDQLPLPTRLLLAVSAAVTKHYWVVLVTLAAAIYTFGRVIRLRPVKHWLDYQLLKLPVFGPLLIGVYMVRLIELLDLLMQAALPIVQAMRVTADSMTNAAIEKDVRGMVRSVEGGRSLTEAFAETRWLTPLVKRMLAIGEHAGRTDQIFAYLKKYYTNQTQRGVKLLSTLIEPIMVTSLAAVVLFFALAIFLPMWKMMKLVGSA